MDVQTMLLLAILGAVLLLVLGMVLFRRTVVATVEGFSWERHVFLAKKVWVEESSLGGFPEGSRNQRSTRESYQSYELARHETRTTTDANGNTTTTTVPVYEWVTRWRTKYVYEIQHWMDSRQLVSSEQNRNPYWPAYALNESVSERVSNTKEKYLVHLQSAKGKQFRREMPEEAWTQFDEKQTYMVKADIFGHIRRVELDQKLPVELPGQIR